MALSLATPASRAATRSSKFGAAMEHPPFAFESSLFPALVRIRSERFTPLPSQAHGLQKGRVIGEGAGDSLPPRPRIASQLLKRGLEACVFRLKARHLRLQFREPLLKVIRCHVPPTCRHAIRGNSGLTLPPSSAAVTRSSAAGRGRDHTSS